MFNAESVWDTFKQYALHCVISTQAVQHMSAGCWVSTLQVRYACCMTPCPASDPKHSCTAYYCSLVNKSHKLEC
jgi:hypothetical protein